MPTRVARIGVKFKCYTFLTQDMRNFVGEDDYFFRLLPAPEITVI